MSPLLSRLAAGEEKLKCSEEKIGKKDMESRLTDLTCPDCRGAIWEVMRGKAPEYRCRVGHASSAKTMLAEHFAFQERTLYSAIVALEEGASLATRLAEKFSPGICAKLLEEAQEHSSHAEALRKVLNDRSPFSVE